MSNLLDSLKGLVSNELVSKVASSMGESEGGISKAIGGILPTLLGGMLNSNPSNHNMIGDLLSKAGGNTSFIGDLLGGIGSGNATSPAMNIGTSLISGLFGNKAGGIANLISNFAGVKSTTSSSLLGIGGSLIASFLGKKMLGEGLNFGGIMNWLGGQKNVIESALPAGLGSFLSGGSADVSTTAKAAASQVSSAIGGDDNKGGGMKWLLPLLLLGLLGFGMWYWLKGCNKEGGETDAAAVENSIDNAANNAATAVNAVVDSSAGAVNAAVEMAKGKLDEAGNWIAEKGEAIKLKLDNGVEIDATKGSLEDKFVSFIKDQNAVAGKDIWFNFEDLLFDTGKATLKASSQKQLDNACAILKAYPNVKIKLGGYTDNVGDSVSNFKLSDSRAKTVYNQMKGKGVTDASFDAKPYEGYGPLHPVADNATAEGRGQNRRISLSVRAK